MTETDFAKSLLALGDRDGAIKELRSILQKNPANIDAWNLLADVSEDNANKIECYREILRNDPNNQIAQDQLKVLVAHPREATVVENVSQKINQKESRTTKAGKPSLLTNSINNLISNPTVNKYLPEFILLVGVTTIVCSVIFVILVFSVFRVNPKPTPTRFVFPPTWTPVSNSIGSILLGASKDYIPTSAEMPHGFKLDPGRSGPLDVPSGEDGYLLAYVNHDNSLDVNSEPSLVWYHLIIHASDSAAITKFIMSSELSQLNYEGQNVTLYDYSVDFPKVDDASFRYGIFDLDLSSWVICVANIRIKNTSALVLVGGILGEDVRMSTDRLMNSCLYFVSLLTEKIH